MCTQRSTALPPASCNIINGWTEDKEGRPSSTRIIKYFYRALEALEIVFRANSATVEGLVDRN